MKNLLILDNLRSGGGKVVGLNYLLESSVYETYYILPDIEEYKNLVHELRINPSRIIYFSKNAKKERFNIINNNKIRIFVRRNDIENILNFTNMPIYLLEVPQYLMIHKAHLVLPINNKYVQYPKKLSLKLYLEKLYIKFFLKNNIVRNIILQTEFMKENFVKEYGENYNISIVPSGFDNNKDINALENFYLDQESLNLFIPTSGNSHKNINYIFEILRMFKDKNKKINAYITIEPTDSMLQRIEEFKIEESIYFIGQVYGSRLKSYYKHCDAIFLPTLLESFCLPYVEAMSHGKVILTSNLDFAKEVCKDNALYFNPFNPEDAVELISRNFQKIKGNEYKIDINNKYLVTWKESYKILDSKIKK